jgi:hypothetical protein
MTNAMQKGLLIYSSVASTIILAALLMGAKAQIHSPLRKVWFP